MLKAGQNLLLNNRLWHLRRVEPLNGRHWELEAIGASTAAQGMTRRLSATRYGDHLFIQQRPPGYWYGHLQHDWQETERGPALNCWLAAALDLLAVHTTQPASGDLPNEFSWSYSRAAKYRQCPRAYYYHYYAAWEGWRQDAPEPVREVYLLKNLTDLPRWSGTLVHDSIKFALARLKAGQPLAEADLLKGLRSRAQADIESSSSGRYRQQPNQLTGFQEHYYRLGLDSSAWEKALNRAEQRLRTFLASSLYADLRRQPPITLLTIEELQAFSLAGTKVWVQMDLVRRAEAALYVYDWKTGEVDPVEVRQQLGVYGLCLRQFTRLAGTPHLPLRAVVYGLAEDKLLEFELDGALLAETEAAVRASVAKLHSLLLDPAANLAELRRFPIIDNLSVCRACQFRQLCER
ncbi:MAG: PD-(D/E)XK nuclease family protein [Anaerolineae bacterium]